MARKLILLVAVTVAIATGTGFAATLAVGSNHLWASTQTLTKGTCTLTGTSQSLDTYVDENKASTSFGSAATLQTAPDTNKRKYAFVGFDAAACNIPTTGGADSATLQLRITSAPNASRTLTVTPLTSTWSGSTTWNTSPSFSASATTSFATGTVNNVSVNVPVTIDVDDLVKGATNYGWRISDNGSASAGDTTQISSSNAASNHPTLVISYEK